MNCQTVIYASNKNINIKFNTEVKSTVTANVMNMNGAVVSSESFNRPSANVSLNMNNLKSGVYVVYLTANNTTTSVKKIFLN